MKSRALGAALAISVLANLWLAYRLKRSSPVVMTTLETGLDASEDEAVESARELAFLRDLLGRWSTFRSATYLQSQVNVLPLLAPGLAQERKQEIQRLVKRVRDQSVEQESRLLRIEEKASHVFHAVSALDLNENGKITSMKIEQAIETEKESPSLENAWGFRATALTSGLAEGAPSSPAVDLRPGRSTVLAFPCAVRGVSEMDAAKVKFKLVTARESELILQPQKDWNGSLPLQVECDKTEFSFELRNGSPILRYAFIPMTAGHPVPLGKTGPAHPNRDLVRRSLERELGFQIEESGK